MTTLLAGLGPAGRGVLTAMLAAGILPEVVANGLVVIDTELDPGGGALRTYDVRSDSAAAVFAECVRSMSTEPELARSSALARILALPDGTSVELPTVGRLLSESATPLLRRLRGLGADVVLGAQVTAVQPCRTGGAQVTVTTRNGDHQTHTVSRLLLAVGGEPHVPPGLGSMLPDTTRHSDEILRIGGVRRVLDLVPKDPRIVIVGRAHSAFAVADRLLSVESARSWSPRAVTVATRGRVRVTYPSVSAARADGAVFSSSDVCPQSGRVWRLCGLRGDSARRYRLGRDGLDPRLSIEELHGEALAERAGRADLVVAATGYRTAALRLLPGASTARDDGSLVDGFGRALPGIRTIGLGSGSRRRAAAGGEPSYLGPVDGVWHYQTVLAPALLEDVFGDLYAFSTAHVSLHA